MEDLLFTTLVALVVGVIGFTIGAYVFETQAINEVKSVCQTLSEDDAQDTLCNDLILHVTK